DGIWKEWVAWSSCSKSCENGTQSRTRVCYYDPTAPVGKPCPGDAKESISCNTERCP
ncbi:hypothetical protein ACJMK2_015694, partial [Sinanodonta woodiana]